MFSVEETKELLKIVLGPMVILVSATVALRQYIHNHKVHEKELSHQAILTMSEKRDKEISKTTGI